MRLAETTRRDEADDHVKHATSMLASIPSFRWTTRKHHPVVLSLSTRTSPQICYDICAEALPEFEYFGTQYFNEVRLILAALW